MLHHDPNDDPFAELSAEVDGKALASPLEFGSGAVHPTMTKNDNSPLTEKKSPEAEDATVVTQEGTHSSRDINEGEAVKKEK